MASGDNSLGRSIRLSVDAQKAIAELKSIGDAGDNSFKRLDDGAKRAGAAIKGTGEEVTRFSGAARGQITGISYQVQDFAVQIAGGTSAMRAFSQQAPQLLSVFGPLGAIAGTAVAVLGGLATALYGANSEAQKSPEAFAGALKALGDIDTGWLQIKKSISGASEAQRQFILDAAKVDVTAARKGIDTQAEEATAGLLGRVRTQLGNAAPREQRGPAFLAGVEQTAEARVKEIRASAAEAASAGKIDSLLTIFREAGPPSSPDEQAARVKLLELAKAIDVGLGAADAGRRASEVALNFAAGPGGGAVPSYVGPQTPDEQARELARQMALQANLTAPSDYARQQLAQEAALRARGDRIGSIVNPAERARQQALLALDREAQQRTDAGDPIADRDLAARRAQISADYVKALQSQRSAILAVGDAAEGLKKRFGAIDEAEKAGTITEAEASKARGDAQDAYDTALRRTHDNIVGVSAAERNYSAQVETIGKALKDRAITQGEADEALKRAAEDRDAALRRERDGVVGLNQAEAAYRAELEKIRQAVRDRAVTEEEASDVIVRAQQERQASYEKERDQLLGISNAATQLRDTYREIDKALRDGRLSEQDYGKAKENADKAARRSAAGRLGLDVPEEDYKANRQEADDLYKAKKISLEERNRAMLLNSENPVLRGSARGVQGMIKDWTDLGKIIEQDVGGAIEGLSEALTQFVMTGKINIRELGMQMLQTFTQQSIQYGIASILKIGLGTAASIYGGGAAAGAGAASGGASQSLFGGMYATHHGGGIVGQGYNYRSIDPALFYSAKKYHAGGLVLADDEVPAILRKGEEVLTEQQRRDRGGGHTVNQTFHISGTPDAGMLQNALKTAMAQSNRQLLESLRRSDATRAAIRLR